MKSGGCQNGFGGCQNGFGWCQNRFGACQNGFGVFFLPHRHIRYIGFSHREFYGENWFGKGEEGNFCARLDWKSFFFAPLRGKEKDWKGKRG